MSRTLPIVLCLLFSAHSVASECRDGSDALFLNQEGYAPGATKLAVLATTEKAPLAWRLEDDSATVLASGNSRPFGNDAASGQHLQHIDFSAYTGTAASLELVTDCAASHRFDIAPGLLDTLPYDALAYFYHNRSGIPISQELAGSASLARPIAHASEHVGCRGGKDSHGNTWPGCDYELDVTGGWYDAGDHGKYVVNGGIATWTLLNYHERLRARKGKDPFSDGQAAIPEAGNGTSDLLDEARYELEFLLRMQAPAGSVAEVPVGIKRNEPGLAFTRIDAAGMAHHKVSDRNWTPLPMPPHLDPEERLLFPVSTAATLNLAAVAAQCARTWEDIDPAFAARCKAAAETAWAAAVRNPSVYFIADFPGSGMYGDGELADEFFWAAAELLISTGDKAYREAILASPLLAGPEREPSWNYVAPLGLMSLLLADDALPGLERRQLEQRFLARADDFLAERSRSGYRLPTDSVRFVWGSNAVLLNRAILLAYAEGINGDTRYRAATADVLDYLLGRNPLDVSYISGYGARPMQNPHHRFWAPSADAKLPGPPPGALSGGPNNTAMIDPVAREMEGKCEALTCWQDHIEAYALNEVAINWNAPLVWVAAYLNED